MFEKYSFKISYVADGKARISEGDCEDFSLETIHDDGKLKITINPKKEMSLTNVEIFTDYKFSPDDCVMPNGYQSWTLTKEWKANEVMKGIRFPVKHIKFGRELAEVFGDYSFQSYPEKPGYFHGYTFGYVRRGQAYDFVGSLSERTGYTCIKFEMNQNRIILAKDVEGKTISAPYPVFDILFAKGSYDEIFDAYFNAMGLKSNATHTCGYCSWYNYFTNINEEIILRDLEGLMRVKDKVNIFQIDDGHQTKVGDWETTDKTKFPNGLKPVADKIHEKGLLAGLWLAPFYAQTDSVIAAKHPEWIIKDESGKPTKGFVGGRNCYTLNFYIKECADYIRGFFNTVLNEWGFDMVKLDFLCSVCFIPFGNRTRGEIMCDAMDFLRSCVGDKLILGCGVPLAPSFGKVDFCRIGSDVDIQFKPRFIFQLTNNEVVCTQTSIRNSIFRRGLDGRAFGNDPDVFFMREVNLKYTESEKRLVAEINKTFGRLLFVSDDVGGFSDKQVQFLNEIYTKSGKQIDFVDYLGNNTVKIFYTEDGQKGVWTVNWLTGENSYAKV